MSKFKSVSINQVLWDKIDNDVKTAGSFNAYLSNLVGVQCKSRGNIKAVLTGIKPNETRKIQKNDGNTYEKIYNWGYKNGIKLQIDDSRDEYTLVRRYSEEELVFLNNPPPDRIYKDGIWIKNDDGFKRHIEGLNAVRDKLGIKPYEPKGFLEI